MLRSLRWLFFTEVSEQSVDHTVHGAEYYIVDKEDIRPTICTCVFCSKIFTTLKFFTHIKILKLH